MEHIDFWCDRNQLKQIQPNLSKMGETILKIISKRPLQTERSLIFEHQSCDCKNAKQQP